MFLPIFHLSAAAINSYAMWYDQMYVELPFQNEDIKRLPLKSRIIYLTIWCLILQIVYYTIALLNDVFGSSARAPKNKPVLRLVKDTVFTLAFPIALFVSAAFWGIYALDKELIFPEHIEKVYPKWLNHVMHTTVALFIFIELLFTHRNYPTRSVGLSITTAFILTYVTWSLTIFARTGTWAYPILEVLNWPLKIMFIVGSYIIALGFYILGEKIHYLTSGNTKQYANGKVKKR